MNALSRPTVFSSSAFALLGLLVAVSSAAAADKPVAAPTRAKSASAVLSKAELRACFDQRDSVRVGAADVARERTELEAGKAELVRKSTEIAARFAAIDQTDAAAVDAYNAEVAEREKAVDALQLRVAAFNEKAGTVAARRTAYVQSCGNRVYEEKDADQLRKNK